ncbi:UNVERIFIED_ORG: hypothetical protein GGE44_000955 [Rhizobium esperanzae]
MKNSSRTNLILVSLSPYMAKVSLALKCSLISPTPVGGKAIRLRCQGEGSTGTLGQLSLDLPWREKSQIRHRHDYREDEDSQRELDHAFRGFLVCVAHAAYNIDEISKFQLLSVLARQLLNDVFDRLSDGIIARSAILLRRSNIDVSTAGECSHGNNLFRIDEHDGGVMVLEWNQSHLVLLFEVILDAEPETSSLVAGSSQL